jgi:hypothetical protein
MHAPAEHVPIVHWTMPLTQLPTASHLGTSCVMPWQEFAPHDVPLSFGVSTHLRTPVEQSHTLVVQGLLLQVPPAWQATHAPWLHTFPVPHPVPLVIGWQLPPLHV